MARLTRLEELQQRFAQWGKAYQQKYGYGWKLDGYAIKRQDNQWYLYHPTLKGAPVWITRYSTTLENVLQGYLETGKMNEAQLRVGLPPQTTYPKLPKSPQSVGAGGTVPTAPEAPAALPKKPSEAVQGSLLDATPDTEPDEGVNIEVVRTTFAAHGYTVLWVKAINPYLNTRGELTHEALVTLQGKVNIPVNNRFWTALRAEGVLGGIYPHREDQNGNAVYKVAKCAASPTRVDHAGIVVARVWTLQEEWDITAPLVKVSYSAGMADAGQLLIVGVETSIAVAALDLMRKASHAKNIPFEVVKQEEQAGRSVFSLRKTPPATPESVPARRDTSAAQAIPVQQAALVVPTPAPIEAVEGATPRTEPTNASGDVDGLLASNGVIALPAPDEKSAACLETPHEHEETSAPETPILAALYQRHAESVPPGRDSFARVPSVRQIHVG